MKVNEKLLEAQALAAEAPERHAERLDLTLPIERAEPVWGKALERGALTLLTGRRGTGKTFLYTGLVAAIARGDALYLGKELTGMRALVIDEENPRFVAQARLKTLGVEDDTALWYYNRNGIRVGEKGWNRWLVDQVQEFKPDLVVVDGLIAATQITDINDQAQAARVYEFLKRLAEGKETDWPCSVLVLHHEKKRQANNPYDRSEAAMGAISLINLADIHLSTELPNRDDDDYSLVKFEREDATGRMIHTEPTLHWLRLRDDIEPDPETFIIESLKIDDQLVELEVRSGIHLAPTEKGRKDDSLRQELETLLERFEVGKEYKAGAFTPHIEGDTKNKWPRLRDLAIRDGRLQQIGSGTHASYRLEEIDHPEV